MLLLLALACATPDDSAPKSDSDTTPITGEANFCTVKTLFDTQCVVCHSGAEPAGALDLQTAPYTAIVGVSSSAYADTTLVVAGDSGASFLYQKMLAAVDGKGDVMPPAGALDSATTDLVRDWIDAGAADCTGEDTGTTPPYHPDGFDDASQHGIAAKFQQDDCLACHGEDLSGGSSGVSCDTCHAADWRTDCTFCHGGTDNTTGAPPEDIDDQTTDLSFSEHTEHVSATSVHVAFDCVQCHTLPADPLSVGHFLVGDDTPGVAETNFAGGLSPAASFSVGTCSNLYCHGNGQGDNGTMTVGGATDCGSCHVDGGLSGEHGGHLRKGLGCADCHGDTASSNYVINDVTLHVNGTPDLTLPADFVNDAGTCTGTCHGEEHRARTWGDP